MEFKFGVFKYNQISDFKKADDFRDVCYAQRKNKKYIVSRYYKDFSFRSEDLNLIKKYGIKAPKIYEVNTREKLVLEEEILGDNVLTLLSENDLDEKIFEKLFEIYRFCRFSKVEINYMPDNFVYSNGSLFYIGREIYKQDENKNLENYGLLYWFPGKYLEEYCRSKNIPYEKSRNLNNGELNKQVALTAIKFW